MEKVQQVKLNFFNIDLHLQRQSCLKIAHFFIFLVDGIYKRHIILRQ